MKSVTDILQNFRRALAAITPMADEAGVKWRDGESYDEWDSVSQALFKSFVVEVIQPSDDDSKKLPFADYDLRYSDYSGLNRIFVKTPTSHDFYTFVAFSTNEMPFDSVRVIDEGNFKISSVSLNAYDAEFFIE